MFCGFTRDFTLDKLRHTNDQVRFLRQLRFAIVFRSALRDKVTQLTGAKKEKARWGTWLPG
jgi:hypothetical protein